MKKLLSRILVVMMLMTTMVPGVSYAWPEGGFTATVEESDITTNSAIITLGNSVPSATYSAIVDGNSYSADAGNNQIVITGLTFNTKYTGVVTETVMVPATTPTDTSTTLVDQPTQVTTEKSVEFTTVLGPDCQIQLIVEGGGIAISSLREAPYTPNTYTLSASAIGTINAYSNAGYKGTQHTYTSSSAINGKITVGFDKMDTIYPSPYAIPYYVTDGYFSGLNADGSDISDHNPMYDGLSATMTATPATSTYALGSTANITLNVDVTDGDGSTMNLVEVDFYENERLIQSFDSSHPVTDSTTVSSLVTIPTSESALKTDGFVMTTTPALKIYTKILNYDLVDRYHSTGAAVVLATATAELVVEIERPTNLWVAADNWAQVYIDGASVVSNAGFLDQDNFKNVQSYIKDFSDEPFVAAEAWDGGVIAGFKLVLMKNNETDYLVTNNDWYYYTGTGVPTPNASTGTEWFDESYVGNDWEPVTEITDPHTNWTAQFPNKSPHWIWNESYITDTDKDTTVYLRSTPPTHTYSVTYDPGTQTTAFESTTHVGVIDGAQTPAAPAMTIPVGYKFDRWNPGVTNTVTKDVTYTAIWTPVNLWVASDDHADVYIDGAKKTSDSSYGSASKYLIPITDDTFVAAKAWDTDGKANIAGFKLVLEKNNKNGYLTTNSTWYYYYKTVDGISIAPPSNGGIEWYQKDYSGEGWLPVTSITGTDPYWAPESNFPTMATWIWSPNFDYPTAKPIDSPIYLRSMVNNPNEPETFTVTYAPGEHGDFESVVTTGLALGADTPAAPTSTPGDPYWFFNGWSPAPIATTVAGMTVYTAQWTYNGPEMPITYSVTYDPGTQPTAFTTTSVGGLTEGAATPPAPTMSIPNGYTFGGWNPTWSSTVLGDTTYIAIWTANEVPTNPRRTTPIVDEPVALVPAPEPEIIIEEEPTALAEDPNVPQTNDSNNILLLLGLLFGSGAGMAVLGRRKKADVK